MGFEEQVMSQVKYLSIFLKSNGGYCVYYPSNIFRNMRLISRESAGSGSAILSYVNHVKVCQLASKISTSDFASCRKRLFGEKVKHLRGK